MSSCILLHVPFISSWLNVGLYMMPGPYTGQEGWFCSQLCCVSVYESRTDYSGRRGCKELEIGSTFGWKAIRTSQSCVLTLFRCLRKLIKVRMFRFTPVQKHLHWKGRSMALPKGKHESMDVGSCIMRDSRGWIDSLVFIEPLLLHEFPDKRQKAMVPLRPLLEGHNSYQIPQSDLRLFAEHLRRGCNIELNLCGHLLNRLPPFFISWMGNL